jgi:hypothetical protein
MSWATIAQVIAFALVVGAPITAIIWLAHAGG